MTPNERAVLALVDLLGWRLADVAELFGTSRDEVEAALEKARAASVRAFASGWQ